MRILISGGTGLVGSAFSSVETEHDLILLSSSECDLRDSHATREMIVKQKPDAVIHLAAKVGGVKGNFDYVADFFHDNIIINTNILEESRKQGIPKVLSLLSTCIYPNNPIYPLSEDQIHNGEPHFSNFGYAYAKRMLEVHSRAIRQQYGLKYITAVPNNIYGPNDNFDLENGHVVPAMIRKFHENKYPPLWGSGSPLREFTYSADIARALLLLIEKYDKQYPINIGNTQQVSIKRVSEIISSHFENVDKVIWDTTKPEGQFKKPSSNKNFIDMFPDFCYTDLDTGLEKTINWFKNNYPNVRGIK